MFSVIVIVFEAIALLFISIFARTNDTASSLVTTYYSLLTDSLALMLAFTLMYTPYRKLSIFSLLLLLVTVAIAAQTALLFDTFWTSCFNGFNSSFQVTSSLITRCFFSSLAVLLTALDFMGLFQHWQVYFIMAPVISIGYGLTEAIIVYGLNTFDGGGGLTVFLYSGVCSLLIWAICIRGNIHPSRYKIKESYISQTFSMIGVVLAFANWPKFNMAGAVATTWLNVNTTTVTIANLLNAALSNTVLGLSTGLLAALLFASKDTKQDKLKFRAYIDCFINGGIVIATYQDIAPNPAGPMSMACLASIATVVVHKYFLTASESQDEGMVKTMMKNYSKVIFRVFFGFFGSIVASIVVASRNGGTPELLAADYPKKAGFQIVAFIIALAFGAIFGALTAVFIKIFMTVSAGKAEEERKAGVEQKQPNEELTDYDYFDGLNDESHPLYYDIFDQINNKESEKININDYTTMIIKQSLLGAQDNPLRVFTTSQAKQHETRAQPPRPQKSELSSQRQDQGKIEVNQSLTAQKSKIKIKEDERLPRDDKNVARKLTYENSSQVKPNNQGEP